MALVDPYSAMENKDISGVTLTCFYLVYFFVVHSMAGISGQPRKEMILRKILFEPKTNFLSMYSGTNIILR